MAVLSDVDDTRVDEWLCHGGAKKAVAEYLFCLIEYSCPGFFDYNRCYLRIVLEQLNERIAVVQVIGIGCWRIIVWR